MNKSVRASSVSVSKSIFNSQARATIECGQCGSLFSKEIPYSNRVSTSCPDCGTINTSNIKWEQPESTIKEKETDYKFWFKFMIIFIIFTLVGSYFKSLERVDTRNQTNIEVTDNG